MALVTTLRNLGPASALLLAEVGIHTAAQLRDVGAPLAYRILSHRQGRPLNLLYLYALAGALDDRDINDYSPEEKSALQEAASGDLEIE